jgi:hypothetical protein
MSLYLILVFVHVVSAITLAAGGLISLFGLFALRRAQRVEQVRSILGLLALSEPGAAVALVLTPAAGLVMTVTTWGWQQGWINVALGSMVLLLLPAGAITGTRRSAIAPGSRSCPMDLSQRRWSSVSMTRYWAQPYI